MTRSKPFLLTLFYVIVVLAVTHFLYLANEQSHLSQATHSLILSPADYQDEGIHSLFAQLAHRISVQPFNAVSLAIFVLALLHIFFARRFTLLAEKLRKKNGDKDSFWVEILHFMGEIEVVFGLWVIPLMVAMSSMYDWRTAISYLNDRNYTEPIFVFVIMALASTKPIVKLAENILCMLAELGGKTVKAWWLAILTIAPLLGSFITEPAAMTIAAILLGKQFYRLKPSSSLAYATLGLLFTNISVGGVLTNFAAPPVLMVSRPWDWSSHYMLTHFGVKAIIGILIANAIYFFIFRKELAELEKQKEHTEEKEEPIPFWISLIHVFFLAWIVVHNHYPVVFVGSFFLFLGFYIATNPYQYKLHLKPPLLVGFFLAGLIVHGTLQAWWMAPILERASKEALMLLCIILTAFNDNAEITFLASLTPNFAEGYKYAVMAGAVTGGGLTIIANAPNLSGYALLNHYFDKGISALNLFLGALFPTIVMALAFYLLQ